MRTFFLGLSMLANLCSPTFDSAGVYVDSDHVRALLEATFTDLKNPCPFTIVATAQGPDATEATIVPHCNVGYPAIRFVELNGAGTLVFVMTANGWVKYAS